jgi:CheY-like chemotaxis protein
MSLKYSPRTGETASNNDVEDGMSDQLNPRILVVDDWHDTADSLAGLFTLWGYDAEACYSGPVALEVARTYLPQVIVLDVGMPGMDGFQVALGLRQMHGLETTIIGVTGYTGEACRASARDAGFDYCLDKPVEMNALRALIGRLAPLMGDTGRLSRGTLTANAGRLRRELFAC